MAPKMRAALLWPTRDGQLAIYNIRRHMRFIPYLLLIEHFPGLRSLLFRVLQHLFLIELEFSFHTFTLFTLNLYGRTTFSILLVATFQTHHSSFKLHNCSFLLLRSSLRRLLLDLPLPSLIFPLQPLNLLSLRKQIANSTFPAKDIAMGGTRYRISGDLEAELARAKW